jgi:NADH-quinone oxidoreductase subunit E
MGLVSRARPGERDQKGARARREEVDYGPSFDPSEIDDLLNGRRDGQEDSLMGVLEEVQARYRYLPKDALILVSESMGVPLSQTYGVATFYNAFSLKPKGRHVISVCTGTACMVRGARKVLERISERLGIQPGETSEDGQFTLETVNCLGACALGPVVVADGAYSGEMTGNKSDSLLKEVMAEAAKA